MERHPDPSLPRVPNGLENRRRLRLEALNRLAAEEQRFAAAALSNSAPQTPGTRRRALRTLAQGVLAILIATFAAPRRLIPAAWAGSDSNSDQNPDNSPGDVYGGPPPDDQEDQNGPPEEEPPPANPSPLQQPVQPSPPAPVYGGPPPGSSN